jgi:peptide-methionine (S)-S-oxide reductase
MWSLHRSLTLPRPEEALPGRPEPIVVPGRHAVSGRPLAEPYPPGLAVAEFALGCFWGAERRFWQTPGVWVTAVGYAGGFTPNPTYEEVCTGRTGHAETVRVVYDPAELSYEALLRVFWEAHDPTQGMRQGNDVGTQYRSVVFVRSEAERRLAEASKAAYEARLRAAGYGPITTEIVGPPAPPFYFAESYHQQYLAKNPDGYCGLGGTGVACPVGFLAAEPDPADEGGEGPPR